MLFISVALVLLALVVLAVLLRDRLEKIAPGWKTKIWNVLLVIGGLAVEMVHYLEAVDFARFGLSLEHAALATLAVGVVGLVISYITKRKDF